MEKQTKILLGVAAIGVVAYLVLKANVIKDDRGQWAHPHEITEINSMI